MAGYANSSGFNTVFFQIYRKGILLFSQQDLQTFVTQAHLKDLKIFFSLWITNPSQQIPSSIYGLGEDGVSLDMSNLSLSSQQSLLVSLKADYSGETVCDYGQHEVHSETEPACARNVCCRQEVIYQARHNRQCGSRRHIQPGRLSIPVSICTAEQRRSDGLRLCRFVEEWIPELQLMLKTTPTKLWT